MPVSRNLITDVSGVLVGNAQDERGASGATVALFEEPATASVAIHGGAPGVRDTALLEPDMTVEKIDAICLSGGSAYGLDAAGGVMNALLARGRGFAIGPVRVPIVPQAILFDLLNGGDKPWLRAPDRDRAPYWDLGREATQNVSDMFALGTSGAGFGATTVNLKGGLGSTSAEVPRTGHMVGALVAVNAVGSATVGDLPNFWAAPYEQASEFGGLGFPQTTPAVALAPRFKGLPAANTNIAIVATDAVLTKAQAKRLAIGAHDGLARALRPVHASLDGDAVFAAATGKKTGAVNPVDLTIIIAAAADCLARAVARAVFEAKALPFDKALPSWRDKFERK
ncbi:P1 family peptidase [Terrarubrum flagellatum]|uniref:P1 family peptidase n=1 Tax=Terrirubrum flagellatum TaxID=2895980 RepID=UPI003144E5BC